MKVMIVEDDQAIRELLAESLKKWNFEVAVLKSFENVLEDFLHEQPAIILLDINLPLFDGFYWCKKIRALLRRSYSYTETQTNVLEHQGVMLNLNDLKVYYEEKKIELTKTEFVILHLLMKNAGSIVSRNKIMRTLWKHEQFIDNNTLSVNITRLRKKLSQLGIENFIKTKKGEGYY